MALNAHLITLMSKVWPEWAVGWSKVWSHVTIVDHAGNALWLLPFRCLL